MKESPLKREVQAVKSILQGGTSSIRDQSSHSQHETQHSKESQRQTKEDKKHKKRNLLEVFKKPSNAKEIGKLTKHRSTTPHVVDKFELECIEVLKV